MFAFQGIAQTPARPEFEAASLKLNRDCRSGPPGIFANGVKPDEIPVDIVGGPAWLTSERYDLNAKAAGNEPFIQMAGPMMQMLLEDRCKLKLHRGTAEVPVYVLYRTQERQDAAIEGRQLCLGR